MSQSLPTTAYIKMIDIWLIFAMMYPFCVVTLYSIMEFWKDRKTDSEKANLRCIEQMELMNSRTIKSLTVMLDWGLPIFCTIFIIMFVVLGLHNYAIAEFDKVC